MELLSGALPVCSVTLKYTLLFVLWLCTCRWRILWDPVLLVCIGAVVWGKRILVAWKFRLLSDFNYYLCVQISEFLALFLTPVLSFTHAFLENSRKCLSDISTQIVRLKHLSNTELFYFLQNASAQLFCYSTSVLLHSKVGRHL